ncbi:MAG TPA: carbonic anhydrase [Solimonas sp.]|nr:carbonic anhydrase [Solimonas sp.]
MEALHDLLERNARWAQRVVAADPQFFKRLVSQQNPQYLWIGCSDSRVPANDIVDLLPGELFVHRNVANVVSHSDVNVQSVIQFAVEVIGVRHIMVVGHYRCSGIHAGLCRKPMGGVSDYWLGHIREVVDQHAALLKAETVEHRREALLCELNVLEQTLNVCNSVTVRNAWDRGQPLTVHGWIYRLSDGRIRHLDVSVNAADQLEGLRERAVGTILQARRKYYAQGPAA